MIKPWILTSVLILINLSYYSQTDTIVRFTSNFMFKDGIYLDFEDFKSNCPAIKREYILDKNGLTASDDWATNKSIYYDDNDSIRGISMTDIWGYSEQGKVYLVKNNRSKRLQIIGAMCHIVLTQDEEYYTDGYYRDRYTRPITREVNYEYIIDFDSGDFLLFNQDNFLNVLKNDPKLHEDYSNIASEKQKKLKMFYYLTRYNSLHPVYFSVSKCTSWLEHGNSN